MCLRSGELEGKCGKKALSAGNNMCNSKGDVIGELFLICTRKRWDMEDLVDHTNLRSLLGGWAGARALELGLKGGVQIGSGREWHSRPRGWITKGREGRNRTGSCGNYTQSEWQEDRCLWRQPRW